MQLFWTARQRKKNRSNAKTAVDDYLGDIIRCKTSHLTQANISPIHAHNNDMIQAEGRDEGTSSLDVTENENHITSFNEEENLSRSEKSQDKNIYSLFSNYKEKAMQISADRLLKIETHFHELLSHTNILLLTPDQHSETLLKVFSEATLNSLHSSLINKFDSRFEEIDIDQEVQVLNGVHYAHEEIHEKVSATDTSSRRYLCCHYTTSHSQSGYLA